ncbi:MAG: Asp-tRNA(Asn)/Glu-tRNA(Gln) amidotransferase subunit GatB [Magnetococcales bacterium]|nr:Asp-tRNA(Asn)/Glu-tRNA(Gln) amidotransferase subunit GatB [Magnetococcales bacterium]NGZ25349.1 Asp-tRNA(Asn)/Glu-tRNA(Gln) amidotransferase subunit GatB [Magnetococcales bacterium]
MDNRPFEMVIGLEVHAQLATRSKLFCGCSTRFGAEANTQICPVCAAFPGVLPVLNQLAVDMAVKTGLAVRGTIQTTSEFARKNYFYPDLPAGYQISQFELPIILSGHVNIPLANGEIKRVGITRIHMEVDAGKSLHEGIVGASWVDLNRTGVPLMEIVSEPDMSSPEEAGEYLKKLRSTLRYLEVCDGNMEEGSFRCDANVSVRPRGEKKLGTRCELKNLNSIRNVMRAITYEAQRQVELILDGGQVVQETRLWDPNQGITRTMRGKEEAHDYRYFPEPDLPPLVLTQDRIQKLADSLPELPDQKVVRFQKDYELSPYDAEVLAASRELAEYFETASRALAASGHNDAKTVANWVMVELLGRLNREGLEITDTPVSALHLAGLIALIKKGTISGKIAKEVFAIQWQNGQDAETIVRERGLVQVTDSGLIEAEVERVIAAYPSEVEQYRSGKTKVFAFFVGQVMKATKGKANPAMVNKLLEDKLA